MPEVGEFFNSQAIAATSTVAAAVTASNAAEQSAARPPMKNPMYAKFIVAVRTAPG